MHDRHTNAAPANGNTRPAAAAHLASASPAAARCACTAVAARCTAAASRCTRECRCCAGCGCQAEGVPAAELLHWGATLRRARAAAASGGLAAMPQQGPAAQGRCGSTFTMALGACRRACRAGEIVRMLPGQCTNGFGRKGAQQPPPNSSSC